MEQSLNLIYESIRTLQFILKVNRIQNYNDPNILKLSQDIEVISSLILK